MIDAPGLRWFRRRQPPGTLTIMVGAETARCRACPPLLGAMGRTITHIGPAGAGQVAKAVNQVILCGTYLGWPRAMVLAMKAGLDPEVVVEPCPVGRPAPGCIANRSQKHDRRPSTRWASRCPAPQGPGYRPGAVAPGGGAAFPVAGLAATLEDGLIAAGFGDDDNSALARAVRSLSGI